MRIFNILFILPFIFGSLFGSSPELYAKEAKEEGFQPRIELPTWLMNEKFHIVSRLTVNLNGNKEEDKVSGTSVTRDELKFLSPKVWRVYRQFPFTGNFEEWLSTKQNVYAMKPSNERILHETHPNEEAWRSVITVAYELARQWSLPESDGDWARWFDKVQDIQEPQVNVEGDSMTITVQTDPKTKIKMIQISASGLIQQDSTKINVNLDWNMSYGENLKLDLKKSLVGGV